MRIRGLTSARRASVAFGLAALMFSASTWGASELTDTEQAAFASAGAKDPKLLVRGQLSVLLASDPSGKASIYALLPIDSTRAVPAVLRLGDADEAKAVVSASAPAEFLGQHDLLDVVVSFTTKTPALTSWHERHYLVRTTSAGQMACELQGDAGSSSKDSEFADRVWFAKTSTRPFRFSATSVGAGHQGSMFFDGVPQKKSYTFTNEAGARCRLVTTPADGP